MATPGDSNPGEQVVIGSIAGFGVSLALAGLPIAEAAQLAKAAETAEMAMVSVGEAGHDAFVAATAMALATTSIPIITGVATWQRPPVTTATAALTVDEISGGRFTLGLGTMPAHWSSDFYGIDPSRPLARMSEYIACIRSAFGTEVDFHGEFFDVTGFRRRTATADNDRTIPISVAATRPGMARTAGRVADSVYFNVIHTTPYLRDVLTPALQLGRSHPDARPHFSRGLMVRCAIDADEERALNRLRASLAMYLSVPYLYEIATASGIPLDETQALVETGNMPAAIAAIPEELVRAMCLLGTERQCAEQLQRYEGLIDWVVFAPPSGLAPQDARAQLEAIIATPWKELL
jgi:5,10-methylenetetrahydromethanopterin reductase